ncbi:hypothetical protein [Mycobacterium sp. HM-7]
MSVARTSVISGRRWVAAAGVAVAAWFTVCPPVARADCTGAGDFGAGSGCAPPGGGSSSAKAWPPTSVDWPPTVDSDSGSGGGDGSADSHPIVLPDGQKPSTTTSRASGAPATPSVPIVPVGSP